MFRTVASSFLGRKLRSHVARQKAPDVAVMCEQLEDRLLFSLLGVGLELGPPEISYDATGTAGLVALADAFRQAGAPERSVLFIALGAEESGLLGSEYYAANPVYPLSQTVGGVNMDALYPQAPARDVKVIGGGKSELDAVLQDAVAAEGDDWTVVTRQWPPEARRFA